MRIPTGSSSASGANPVKNVNTNLKALQGKGAKGTLFRILGKVSGKVPIIGNLATKILLNVGQKLAAQIGTLNETELENAKREFKEIPRDEYSGFAKTALGIINQSFETRESSLNLPKNETEDLQSLTAEIIERTAEECVGEDGEINEAAFEKLKKIIEYEKNADKVETFLQPLLQKIVSSSISSGKNYHLKILDLALQKHKAALPEDRSTKPLRANDLASRLLTACINSSFNPKEVIEEAIEGANMEISREAKGFPHAFCKQILEKTKDHILNNDSLFGTIGTLKKHFPELSLNAIILRSVTPAITTYKPKDEFKNFNKVKMNVANLLMRAVNKVNIKNSHLLFKKVDATKGAIDQAIEDRS